MNKPLALWLHVPVMNPYHLRRSYVKAPGKRILACSDSTLGHDDPAQQLHCHICELLTLGYVSTNALLHDVGELKGFAADLEFYRH